MNAKKSLIAAAIAAVALTAAPARAGNLLGPVSVGFNVGLVSLPQPLAVGVEAKAWDLVGLGFHYNAIPGFITNAARSAINNAIGGKAQISDYGLSTWDVEGRVYPFQGAFFLGGGIGQLSNSATAQFTDTSTTPNTTHAVSASESGTFFQPKVGWLWTWNSGFTMGLDASMMMTLSRSNTVTADAAVNNSQDGANAKAAVQNGVDLLWQHPVPTLNWRIGWMF